MSGQLNWRLGNIRWGLSASGDYYWWPVAAGVLGANISKVLLDWSAVKDPIARGMSTAASSHGIGTAALVASEPDALPFCALAYALVGITSTILMSVPLLRSAIIAITG